MTQRLSDERRKECAGAAMEAVKLSMRMGDMEIELQQSRATIARQSEELEQLRKDKERLLEELALARWKYEVYGAILAGLE